MSVAFSLAGNWSRGCSAESVPETSRSRETIVMNGRCYRWSRRILIGAASFQATSYPLPVCSTPIGAQPPNGPPRNPTRKFYEGQNRADRYQDKTCCLLAKAGDPTASMVVMTRRYVRRVQVSGKLVSSDCSAESVPETKAVHERGFVM